MTQKSTPAHAVPVPLPHVFLSIKFVSSLFWPRFIVQQKRSHHIPKETVLAMATTIAKSALSRVTKTTTCPSVAILHSSTVSSSPWIGGTLTLGSVELCGRQKVIKARPRWHHHETNHSSFPGRRRDNDQTRRNSLCLGST
jgi:hypothetical protein